jgi:hypothetical protein
MKPIIKRIVLILGAGILVAGCATSRGVMNVEPVEVANPKSSVVVKIVEVVDARVFELKPKHAYTPSLKNGEVDNPAITSRAIARKRNGFGAALGDILLPENRTVAQVTEEALARALKESGYRVASKGDPDYAAAVPLKAKIEKFWGWLNIGFWTLKVNHNTKVALEGDWPLNGENRIVEGKSRLARAIVSGAVWRESLQAGLDDFVENVKSVLKQL